MDAKELTDSDIEKAYLALTEKQRAVIDDLVDLIIVGVKKRHLGKTPAQFSERHARELLAKLGVWAVQHSVGAGDAAKQ